MTGKIYRTAQGKPVDLGAIQLQNENVRAVGNMHVNARGDIIDNKNQTVESRNKQLTRQYGRQVTNVQDDQVIESRKKLRPAAVADPVMVEESLTNALNLPAETTTESQEISGGLAAAIARARQIKQEPLKTPRQQAQDTHGVRKI
jgi:hypothetical protein